jgi:glycosyltransferase involved in cell wall biosynthesis
MTKPRGRKAPTPSPLGRPLRILLVTDAIWSQSGYAVQGKLMAPRWKSQLGIDVAVLATYGLQGARIEWGDLPIFPGGLDPFANDVIPQAAKEWQADAVITLKDSFVFKPEAVQGLRFLPMVPIDHDPIPPSVTAIVRHALRPIAYAQHGYRALHDAGFDPRYAPHAYDPKVYYPMDKAEARKALGISEEAFIIGTVAVNRGGLPSRKAWDENLGAFSLFARAHADAYYFIHTDIADDGREGGLPLRQIAAEYGVADRVVFCDQGKYRNGGFPEEYMRTYYASLDVLNAVSVGEGFGIPTLEAQACGTPVIVGDWCASAELCFSGWKVPDARGHAARFRDGQMSFIRIPHPESIAERMEEAYNELRTKLRGDHLGILKLYPKEVAKLTAPYQIDHVIQQHWKPIFDELAAEIAQPRSRGVLRIIRPEEVAA